MADYNGFLPPDDFPTPAGTRLPPASGVVLDPSGTTTYVYLTTGGFIGSTTSIGSIPAGASRLYTRAS